MRRRGRLARTGLDVDDGDDLQMIVAPPAGQISPRRPGPLLKHFAQCLNVSGRVMAPPAGPGFRAGAAPLQVQLAQIGILDAQKSRHLAAGERPQGPLGIGRETLRAMRLQTARQRQRMVADQLVDAGLLRHPVLIRRGQLLRL